MFLSVLQIRDVYPGSRIRFFHLGSRIQGQKDSGSRILIRIKELYNPKKLFLSFRIPDPNVFTHPESRIQGSKRHRIPDPEHCFPPQNLWSKKFWAKVPNLTDRLHFFLVEKLLTCRRPRELWNCMGTYSTSASPLSFSRKWGSLLDSLSSFLLAIVHHIKQYLNKGFQKRKDFTFVII